MSIDDLLKELREDCYRKARQNPMSEERMSKIREAFLVELRAAQRQEVAPAIVPQPERPTRPASEPILFRWLASLFRAPALVAVTLSILAVMAILSRTALAPKIDEATVAIDAQMTAHAEATRGLDPAGPPPIPARLELTVAGDNVRLKIISKENKANWLEANLLGADAKFEAVANRWRVSYDFDATGRWAKGERFVLQYAQLVLYRKGKTNLQSVPTPEELRTLEISGFLAPAGKNAAKVLFKPIE